MRNHPLFFEKRVIPTASLADILPIYLEKQFRLALESCLITLLSQEAEILVEHDSESRWWRFLASPLIPNAEPTHSSLLPKQNLSQQCFQAIDTQTIAITLVTRIIAMKSSILLITSTNLSLVKCGIK
jgi:hypothetical protein